MYPTLHSTAMNRRAFLQNCAAATAASTLLPNWLQAAHRAEKFKIGFQSWVVREPLNADFAGTLKKMAGMGYQGMEMCSPLGYGKYGFGPLAEMPVKEMKRTLEGEGIECISTHVTFQEMTSDLMASVEFAHKLGLEQLIVSATNVGKDGSLDDWKRAADTLNEWGDKVTREGLIFGFHNHHFEFVEKDGELVYDVLLDRLNPDTVGMQFQVAVVNIGYHAANYFRSHPGRFLSAHLADWSKEKDGQTPIGGGDVDWPDFFEAAEAGGLKNIYVEMGPDFLPDSATYLNTIL